MNRAKSNKEARSISALGLQFLGSSRGSLLVLFLAGLAVALSLLALLKAPSIGYVDSAQLMEQYSGAEEARAQLQQRAEEWDANIRTLQEEIGALNEAVVSNAAEWTRNELQMREDSLSTRQTELARYTRAVTQQATELESELMQPVFDELNAHIRRFGEEKGYDVLFGTVAGGNILYGRDPADVTDELLNYLEAE